MKINKKETAKELVVKYGESAIDVVEEIIKYVKDGEPDYTGATIWLQELQNEIKCVFIDNPDLKPSWKTEISKVNKCPQRQDGLQEQLKDLTQITNVFGFYDAADFLNKHVKGKSDCEKCGGGAFVVDTKNNTKMCIECKHEQPK